MGGDYRDSKSSPEARVEDLLSRMTVEEKIAQLKARVVAFHQVAQSWLAGLTEDERAKFQRYLGPATWKMYHEDRYAHAAVTREAWKRRWQMEVMDGDDRAVGELSAALRDFRPAEGVELANRLQDYVVEKSRLSIPVLIHDECLHGCVARGSAIFPQSIGMAASWRPDLLEEVAKAIGRETRARGIHQCLSPTVNIARDVRCGRTEETYGEDPYLASRMAAAFVRGVQSQGVAATPKHFVANFVGPGGRDSNEVPLTERHLRDIYFPVYRAAVEEAGALSIMPAYNALDGVPCSSHRRLLTEVLRGEWGFRGYVVSDYGAVAHIHEKHRVAETKAQAAKQALEAGMDMELPASDCFEELGGLVKTGELSQDVLDEAVRRVLRVKFRLGLLDDPHADPAEAERLADCPEHRRLALEAARRTITLLKNDGILPLGNDLTVAVVGPNAERENIGEYSGYDTEVVTPLQGIRSRIGPENVLLAGGCDVTGGSRTGFDAAVRAAEAADVAVLCMGNFWDTEGEGRDRSSLDLPGVQEELIAAVTAAGKPVVVVLFGGSAVTMERWIGSAAAVVEAWYPGEEGGTALADVLFGDAAPGGKLPMTFPKRTGQCPLYYNPEPSGRGDTYADLRGEQAQFPFGHGLSYTTFEYSDLEIDPAEASIASMGSAEDAAGAVSISANVANTGDRAGDEVVQLYVHDLYASVARPVKELKGFQRITLKPGQSRTVSFRITAADLSFTNAELQRVVEPGEWEIMVGSSSRDIRLLGVLRLEA